MKLKTNSKRTPGSAAASPAPDRKVEIRNCIDETVEIVKVEIRNCKVDLSPLLLRRTVKLKFEKRTLNFTPPARYDSTRSRVLFFENAVGENVVKSPNETLRPVTSSVLCVCVRVTCALHVRV